MPAAAQPGAGLRPGRAHGALAAAADRHRHHAPGAPLNLEPYRCQHTVRFTVHELNDHRHHILCAPVPARTPVAVSATVGTTNLGLESTAQES